MTITPETPWRSLPPLPRARFVALLAGTPLSTTSNAIYDALGEDLAMLAVLIGWREQGRAFGNVFAQRIRNPWLMRPRDGLDNRPMEVHPRDGVFLAFPSYDAAATELRYRLTDPAYKPTDPGVYARTVSLLDLNKAYSPKGDGANDPVARTNAMVIDANNLIGDEPMATFTTPIPGLPTPITTSFPVKVAILPAAQKLQRPGHGFTGGRSDTYTQHDTGNPKPGMDAEAHRRYLEQGAPDNAGNKQQLSYHLTVDDYQAIVLVPLNEVCWHAGDSAGPGNFDSIACELCVNVDQDRAKARANAAELAAAVMGALGLGPDRLVPHRKWSGKDCPHSMFADASWGTFFAAVAAKLAGVGPPPPPVADWFKVFPGLDASLARDLFGAIQIGDVAAPFDPTGAGVLSRLWFENGATTGVWPPMGGPDEWTGKLRRFDDGTGKIREYARAGGGLVSWRPSQAEPFRLLKRA